MSHLKIFGLGFGIFLCASFAIAASGYNQPPKEILDVMQAPDIPYGRTNPTKDRMFLVSVQNYPSIERVAEPFLRLAGVRIEQGNHSRHDAAGGNGIPKCVQSFSIVTIADGTEKKIDISKLACMDHPEWSADGKNFFFKNKTAKSVELWIGDAKTAKISRIPNVKINPMLGDDVQWMPLQKSLLVKMIPKNLGTAPKVEQNFIGPSIQLSVGEKGQSSTYEKRDTLKNKNDEMLFDYYAQSQLALIDIKSKKVTLLGKPDLYDSVEVAPDNNSILTTKIVRPYSYLVTYFRFPHKVEVLDIKNPNKIATTLIADLPLAERVPIHGVPTGPRGFRWHPLDPATLIWAEALDGGDWNNKVPYRDKVMMLAAPFKDEAKELFKVEQRYSGLAWTEKRDTALLYEYNHNLHWVKTFIVNPDKPEQRPQTLFDMSSEEEYKNPGDPVYKTLSNGYSVIRYNQNAIFLSGQGSSPEGDRPFLDKLDLVTRKTERLFRSSKTELERFMSFP
ncbi:MAG: hypothetical protein J7501_09715, partial [Bdellovibrio sp.]|nr:hypothetical protein [Bdellovibrio sp.]